MERVSATSRSEIGRVYSDNALYGVVRHICLPYAASFDNLRLLPEEVFQQVMAWLDWISREEDDYEVMARIGNAWYDQRLELAGLAAGVPEAEVDRATGLVLVFLLTCLVKLGRIPSAEGDFYASLRVSLMGQLAENMAGFHRMVGEITTHPYYLRHNGEVNDWLVEYMLKSAVTFTDSAGRLKTSITKAGKQKGRKGTVLFPLADGGKDENLTRHWAGVFRRYLAGRNRSSAVIDSTTDNIVLRSIHAFKQYWEGRLGYRLPSAGSAYLSFLTDDCGLLLGEKKDHTPIKASTVSDSLTRRLGDRLGAENGDLLKLEQFMLKEQ